MSVSLTSPLNMKSPKFKFSLKYISRLISNFPFLILLIIKLFKLEGFVLIIIFFNWSILISFEDMLILSILGFDFTSEIKSK